MSLFITTPIRCSLVLIISAMLVSGCSSSSDSNSADTNGVAVGMEDASAGVTTSGTQTESTEGTNESTAGSETESTTESPDSVVPSTTRVNFEITIPKFQSNALLVQLSSAEADLVDAEINARWISDESWSAVVNLPFNTEATFTITFYDKNGAIILGTYDQFVNTQTSADLSYLVQADQFETASWDDDGDGVSNLDESLAGTDPIINESISLELNESFANSEEWLRASSIILLDSAQYESVVPTERPSLLNINETTPVTFGDGSLNNTSIKTIALDDNGTGSFYHFDKQEHSFSDFTSIVKEGTRTNTGSSILWVTSYERWQADSAVRTTSTATIETKVAADDVWSQDGTIEHMHSNNIPATTSVSYSLSGSNFDDPSYCVADSGSIAHDFVSEEPDGSFIFTATATKITSDIYWTVTITNFSGDQIEQFLAPSLSPEFYCDFSDL